MCVCVYTLSVAPITFAYADLKQPDSESTQAAVAKCIRVYNGTRWKGNRLKYGGAMCLVQCSTKLIHLSLQTGPGQATLY